MAWKASARAIGGRRYFPASPFRSPCLDSPRSATGWNACMPRESAAPPIVTAEHLTIVYPTRDGDVTALRDFSLSITPGEIVGLIGEGGCGKSTAALLRPPARAVSSSVHLGPHDLLRMSRDAAVAHSVW